MPDVITIVGLTVVDQVYSVQSLPNSAGKHFASHYAEHVGGIATNASITVARLDGNVRLVTPIGSDQRGAWAKLQLQSMGVNTDSMIQRSQLTTPCSSVFVDESGERLIVNHTDAALLEQAGEIPFSIDANSCVVMTDLRWTKGAQYALYWARQHHKVGLLDFDQAPHSEHLPILSLASHVVFGEQALYNLTDSDNPHQALDAAYKLTACAYIAVTLGEKGILWKAPSSEIQHIPSRCVSALNTLGAGDVFHGACALSLSKNSCFKTALTFANDVAAYKVTHSHNDGFPNYEQLDAFIRELTI